MRELHTNEVGQVSGGLGWACAGARALISWAGKNKAKAAAASVGAGVAAGAAEELATGAE